MKKRRYAMTLLEIMIVIFIIGLIGSVIGYNMQGSLQEGKAFKSQQGSKQIYDLLQLEMVKSDLTATDIEKSPKAYLEMTGFVRNVDKYLKDGWGKSYIITANGDDLYVTSTDWVKYLKEKKKKTDTQISEDFPWVNPAQAAIK